VNKGQDSHRVGQVGSTHPSVAGRSSTAIFIGCESGIFRLKEGGPEEPEGDRQFREAGGDLEVNQYTPDHVWSSGMGVERDRDEKKRSPRGNTKNNKLSPSLLFGFASRSGIAMRTVSGREDVRKSETCEEAPPAATRRRK